MLDAINVNGSPQRNVTANDSALILSPSWRQRLQSVKQSAGPRRSFRLIPRNPDYYTEKLNIIESAPALADAADLAYQRQLTHVAFDFEYQYSRPGVLMKTCNGEEFYWHDPRSIVPLLLSLAMVEPTDGDSARIYQFVVDLRARGLDDNLVKLFSLPAPFIAHYAGGGDLACLWQRGIPEPRDLWDTWVAEKSFHLGLHHNKYTNETPQDGFEEQHAKETAEEKTRFLLKLESTCQRHGVGLPFSGPQKDNLQQSFLDHPVDRPFSQEHLEYAAADALAVAQLYPRQVQAALQNGCLQHLLTVEMPWTITNARARWHGVRVDDEKLHRLAHACDQHIVRLQSELSKQGLNNVNSHPLVWAFMTKLGLIELFRKGRGYCFDDKHLEAAEDRHPAIHKIRLLRKILRLRAEKLFTGELVGADGRLHPEHRQLGAESSRNSMRWPNIGGIGRALRPVVVPDSGWAIGEVDLSQIEVGIAAAVYGDQDLVQMFNGRDVYVAMAKRFYADLLTAEQQNLPDSKFKKNKKLTPLRDKMKVLTLAIIYGVSEHGLSVILGISRPQAARELEQFMEMFPDLATALQEAVAYGGIRGCAQLCSGLRRHRGRRGRPSNWEANWLRNTPVQGSAAVVFKAAGNRLDRRYQHYGAKLILPMHDAFVFECPKQHLQAVAKVTAEELRGAVQVFFPQLDPRVDINIDHPRCWNKDGKWRSLDRWMMNPDLGLG